MDSPNIWRYVPHLLRRDNRRRKKREVAEFINRETHIKIAELVEEILNNQLLKAVSLFFRLRLSRLRRWGTYLQMLGLSVLGPLLCDR